MERLCLVTAFIDIGRQEWNTFKRSNRSYLNAFLPHLQLHEEIIIFLDDTQVEMKTHITDLVNSHSYKNYKVTLIDINGELLKSIRSWSYIAIEKEIMESEKYRRIISHRQSHPEHSIPKYNVVQHCKTDFIKYIIDKGDEITDAKYLAWTDFGFFNETSKYKEKDLRYSKLPYKFPNSDDVTINNIDISFITKSESKIHYCCVKDLSHKNRDVIRELQQAPEHFGGFFFMGSREAHLEYNKLYHQVLNREFYDRGLTDDDQHVMLRCYIEKEDSLFVKWVTGWHNSYIYFQQK